METQEAAIVARGLEVHSSRGRVFGPVSFEVEAGTVVAVLGASGSGKTALLLALTARMRASRGSASVHGLDLARNASRVRKLTGLGLVAGVNDFEPGLTVRQHVSEQRSIVGRARRTERDVLVMAGMKRAGQLRARDLTAEQRVRLGLALALVGSPQIVAVDDLDRDLTAEQIASVGATLRSLASEGLTFLVACLDAGSAGFADSVVWATEPADTLEEVCARNGEVARAFA